MSLEMAKEWLKSASFDLENISYIIKAEHLSGVVAFHAQQAIEKSLKAYLEYNKINIPKTHKLQNLLGRVDIEFGVDENTLQLIDKLYIDSRYPEDLGLRKWVHHNRSLFNLIKHKIQCLMLYKLL